MDMGAIAQSNGVRNAISSSAATFASTAIGQHVNRVHSRATPSINCATSAQRGFAFLASPTLPTCLLTASPRHHVHGLEGGADGGAGGRPR
jgi:hypothetical protein